MTRIFISYRRLDSEGYVGRLYDHLIQHFERGDIFMDVDAIRPGEDFVTVLENAVQACDVLIAVIGLNWVAITTEQGERRLDQWNDFVRIEIATALRLNKRVIPVLVQRATMPRPVDLPEDLAPLARRNALELSHERFGYDVGKLVDAIKNATQDIAPSRPILPMTPQVEGKAAQLKALGESLLTATESPLYAFRTENGYFPVIGEGYPAAKIMFIGQAPGKYEAEKGRPFVGPSGEILAEMLASIGLRREEVYVTNIVLDHPPKNRDPMPNEIAFYTPYLDQIIDIVQPLVIATLGSYAMNFILKKYNAEQYGTITQLHGKLIPVQVPYGEIHIVPLYHPAVVLYTASKKAVLMQDFQKLRVYV